MLRKLPKNFCGADNHDWEERPDLTPRGVPKHLKHNFQVRLCNKCGYLSVRDRQVFEE